MGTSAMPPATADVCEPSHATSGSWSERLTSMEISVGTAASQLSDWPWHPSARQATMVVVAASAWAGEGWCFDEQQVRFATDDLQQSRFARQQLFAASETFTTFAASG